MSAQWRVNRPHVLGFEPVVVAAETPLDALRRVARMPFPVPPQCEDNGSDFVYNTSLGVFVISEVVAEPADTEEVVAVVIAVHNGIKEGDQMMFNQTPYALPISVLAQVKDLVEGYEIG